MALPSKKLPSQRAMLRVDEGVDRAKQGEGLDIVASGDCQHTSVNSYGRERRVYREGLCYSNLNQFLNLVQGCTYSDFSWYYYRKEKADQFNSRALLLRRKFITRPQHNPGLI